MGPSRRAAPWTMAAVVAAGVAVAAGLLGAVADFDRDDVPTWREWRDGTAALDGDSDGDGLPDGHESSIGTDARRADSDADGLTDGQEVVRRSDPLSADTDADGIPDAAEPVEDCDGDGIPAIASSDDDGDGRPDADEPIAHRCRPDVDGDTVRDGHEGAMVCVTRPDCDDDGLDDGTEQGLGFDALDPDTFGTGLVDAVAYAFQQAGQQPTSDRDLDGIPDGWESEGGLIDWGGMVPEPGRRDLLVEYIRVQGPESGDYAWLDFTPAYQAVADMFGDQADIEMQWRETVVELPQERRPDFLTEEDLDHYLDVLSQVPSSTNPYVTSVVLNPQQVQTDFGDILGAAFMRNMILTIDYGAHTELLFETDDGVELVVRPVLESHILADRPAFIEALGFDDGGELGDGRLFLRDDHFAPIDEGYTITWEPDWFQTAPVYTTDSGHTFETHHAGAEVKTGELARTIAHEMGHTLGLCHTHLVDCRDRYGVGPEVADNTSMSYTSSMETLRFLPEEWTAAMEVLRCPPQATLALVAQRASDGEILESKYAAAFSDVVEQRVCLVLDPVPAEFDPDLEPTGWGQPSQHADHAVPQDGWVGLALYMAVAAGVAGVGAGLAAWLATRPKD